MSNSRHHAPFTISQRETQKQATRTKDDSETCDPTQRTSVRPTEDWKRSRRHHRHCRRTTDFERRSRLLVSPALNETQEGRTHVQITNPLDYQITINVGTAVASFKIMTPKQAINLQPMTNHQLNLILQYPDDAEAVLNQIFQDPTAKSDRRWYPTPQTCDDPSKLNKIEKRIYDEIVKLREQEKLDPTASEEQRHEFLENFQWEQSILSPY